jgi:predicted ATP-grasp superfamily ATP-dependent carboligase
MAETLIILGASARAAAFSARRAGFLPVCGDLFADADLQGCCPAYATADYPAGLADIALAARAGPWMYTGGLENYPSLVGRISKHRQLWGVAPHELNRIRDPQLVAACLRSAGLPCPNVQATPAGLPVDGSWLLKNRRSSGGGQVFPWRGQQVDLPTRSGWYFQQRIAGTPCSAVYVAAAGRGSLLGITEQLLTEPAPGKMFCYAGSIGPRRFLPAQAAHFERLGNALAAEFDLRGLFGVDAIATEDAVLPVEINPRYVASTEILERGLGFSAIALHAAACREDELPAASRESAPSIYCGKAILYARRDIVIDEALAAEWLALNQASLWPDFADVPAAGSQISAGQPVVTLFASAGDLNSVRQKLADELARWQRRLDG